MKRVVFKKPPILKNAKGEVRRVGFELEYSGLTLKKSAEIIIEEIGGRVEVVNPYHFKIKDTEYGTFTLVLDFQFLVESGLNRFVRQIGLEESLEKETIEAIESFIAELSETVVPYEVSTPPLPLDSLDVIETIKERLREHGAVGTKAEPFYAFGFHINPEVAVITVDEILNTLRAFFILYDYLVEMNKPDIARRFTPYIDPFDKEYIERVLDPQYDPTMRELIDDYLDYNPTRNRALDLLPLFAWIDEDQVMRLMHREKVVARPTYHYRLPNSRIDEIEWKTFEAWNSWVLVERLAQDKRSLEILREEYLKYFDSPFFFFQKSEWIEEIIEWIIDY
jgi:hypothetical protein